MTVLIPLAMLYGVAAALIFRRFTDAAKLRLSVNRILAHIMEFRLFIDEPGLIWRAQKAAFVANAALLKQIALPCLLMAAPLALAWPTMARHFGHSALKPGEATVMTAHTDPVPCFAGLLVESPGVYLPRTGETVWRVRLVRPLKGPLPAGVTLRYPKSNLWILVFVAASTLSAVAVSWLKAFRRVR
jgi:hypothetical protein